MVKFITCRNKMYYRIAQTLWGGTGSPLFKVIILKIILYTSEQSLKNKIEICNKPMKMIKQNHIKYSISPNEIEKKEKERRDKINENK